MLAKVGNIFRVNQIFFTGVLIVVLFEVMDLVFVLIITVMAWTQSKVRQFQATLGQVKI